MKMQGIDPLGIMAATLVPLAVMAFFLFKHPFHARQAGFECNVRLACLWGDFYDFACDHGDNYPWSISTNQGGTAEFVHDPTRAYMQFLVLSNSAGSGSPRALVCPQDTRRPVAKWDQLRNENVSYFLGSGSSPSERESVVAGDRNVITRTNGSSNSFAWNAIGLHGDRGNVLLAGNRVLRMAGSERLNEQMHDQANLTNRLIIP